jgi:SPP1 gp7 family putative phage head morphogenesis protein
MASNDYLRLCQEAQNKKLKLAKQQEQQIKQIYSDMYKDLSKKLKKVNKDTLTERYLEELQKELAKEIKQANSKVKKNIKINMSKSSKLATDVQLDFFMSIDSKYKLDMKDTFANMFSKIPKQAMNEILFGEVYKDRKGLNKRIWKHTKKFEKDIDYILTEGIANKKSIYEIAKDLEIYVKPNSIKPWEWSNVYPNASKTVDYNSQRLARTAVNHAYQQAQKRSCKRNPFVSGIKWLTSNSHRTCELCSSRNGVIYSVSDLPLDHANGLCTTMPVLEKELDQIGEELRDWIDGESNPKLDKWFKEYGKDFI